MILPLPHTVWGLLPAVDTMCFEATSKPLRTGLKPLGSRKSFKDIRWGLTLQTWVVGESAGQVESDVVSFNCAMGAAAAGSCWRQSLKLLGEMKRCEVGQGGREWQSLESWRCRDLRFPEEK